LTLEEKGLVVLGRFIKETQSPAFQHSHRKKGEIPDKRLCFKVYQNILDPLILKSSLAFFTWAFPKKSDPLVTFLGNVLRSFWIPNIGETRWGSAYPRY